jgi:phosphatidate cytidylyltransferase
MTPLLAADVNGDLWMLLLGLGGVLVVASAIGFYLAQGKGADNPVIENLNARINAWWVMIILMGLALTFGRAGAVVLFALCSFAALREFMTLTDTRRADHMALAAAFFVVIPVQYWLVWDGWYGFYSIFIPVYAFLLLPIIVTLRGDTGRFLSRVAELQWALMVCVFSVSHVPALLSLEIPGFEGRNVLLIAFLVVVVQGSDVAQYIWGKLLGRTKIAPSLSPSKTWEGFIGGVASAVLIGAALSWLTPFTPFQAGGMALVIVLMGFFGGLVMSAIKRDRGVKDWGQLIAGHGGFIDRLDSVIFSAPIFFHLTRYFWSTV